MPPPLSLVGEVGKQVGMLRTSPYVIEVRKQDYINLCGKCPVIDFWIQFKKKWFLKPFTVWGFCISDTTA